MKRKIFAALLAVMMVVSMLPLSVMAEVTIVKSGRHLLYVHNGVNNDVMKYTIEFPEGVNAPAVNFADYVGDVTLPGYTFNGWAFFHQDDSNNGVEEREVHKYHVDGVEQPYYPANYTINYADKTDFIVLYAHNVPTEYTITVNQKIGGKVVVKVNGEEGKTTATVKDTISFEVVPDEGYSFNKLNYSYGTGGGGLSDASNLSMKMPAGNLSVNAEFVPNKYTITFDTDGGSEIASIEQDYGTEITAPEAPTKTGYTFAGWVGEDGKSVDIPATMPARDMTIKAKWNVNQYTITFANTGDTVIAPITQNYGTAVTAPANPTKEGYTFAGWVDEEGNSVKIPETMPANNVEVTATWTTNAYNLDFDGNSGYVIDPDGNEVEKLTRTIFYGNDFAMPKAVRDGYTFAGWSYTNAEGDEIICAAGDTVNSLASEHGARIALTARWTKNNYTIEFALDGGEISEEECTALQIEDNLMACKYAKDYVLPTPTKTGYTFMGWEFEKDGETVVKLGGETVRNLTTKDGDTVTLTAQWEENLYTLHFDSNGGEAVKTKTLRYNAEYTVPATTRDGYTFLGWECVNRSTKEVVDFFEEGEVITKLTDKHGAHFDLTAQWDVNVYTLHFDSNGGEAVKTKSLRYESEYTIPATTREGYIFLGWECVDRSTKESVGFFEAGTVISKLTDKHGAHFDLTAQWELIEYRLQFNAGKDQGTFADGNRFFNVTMTIEDGAYVLAEEPTRIGYELLGWKVGDEKVAADYAFTVAELLEIAEVSYDANGNPYFKITARWNGSDVTVEYAFTSGAKLPEEVMALLPVDENVYHEGDVITAPVIADSVDVEGGRWKFEGWSVDSYTVTAEDAESGEIVILGNWRFLQKFERPKFEMPRLNFRSIVIDTTEGGKTDVSGKTVGAMGSTRKFVITPDEGFEIDEVLVNGKPVEVSKNGEISFVVTDHTHVEVYFAEIEG